ncbi:MAG TPA: hypothetical protein VGI42_00310 [Chthoniobacterales bacterium]
MKKQNGRRKEDGMEESKGMDQTIWLFASRLSSAIRQVNGCLSRGISSAKLESRHARSENRAAVRPCRQLKKARTRGNKSGLEKDAAGQKYVTIKSLPLGVFPLHLV